MRVRSAATAARLSVAWCSRLSAARASTSRSWRRRSATQDPTAAPAAAMRRPLTRIDAAAMTVSTLSRTSTVVGTSSPRTWPVAARYAPTASIPTAAATTRTADAGASRAPTVYAATTGAAAQNPKCGGSTATSAPCRSETARSVDRGCRRRKARGAHWTTARIPMSAPCAGDMLREVPSARADRGEDAEEEDREDRPGRGGGRVPCGVRADADAGAAGAAPVGDRSARTGDDAGAGGGIVERRLGHAPSMAAGTAAARARVVAHQ